jgi:hypothetical protein
MDSRFVLANAAMHTNVDDLHLIYQYDVNDEDRRSVQPAIVRFIPSTFTTTLCDVPVNPSEVTHSASYYSSDPTTTAAIAHQIVWQEIEARCKSTSTFPSATGENTYMDTSSANFHETTLPTTTLTALQLQLLRSCEESASQPMLIMCDNDKSSLATTTTSNNARTTTTALTGAGCASAIITLACDDDGDDVDYNETFPTNRHVTMPTTPHATIPIPDSITPLLHTSPTVGPVLPFFNPGNLMHIAESRRPVDVLIGKSQVSKMHVGNVAFRAFVHSRLDHYQKSTRRGFRIAACVSITNAVFAAGGRFYAPLDRKCRRWEEANVSVARIKVGNSIRDSLKKAESGTTSADFHKFSGSTSYTDIVNYFMQEMAVINELSGVCPFPQRSPPVVIDTSRWEECRTDVVKAKSSICGGHDRTTTSASSNSPRPAYKLTIYSFVPRDGARVATLIAPSKKRKRDPTRVTKCSLGAFW